MEHPQESMAKDRVWVAVGTQQDAGTLMQVIKAVAAKSSGYSTILHVYLYPCVSPSLCVSISVYLHPCVSPSLGIS